MSDVQSILDGLSLGTDNNSVDSGVGPFTVGEILADLMAEEPIEEPCVSGACVMCSNATVNSTPAHIVKDIGKVELNGLVELNKKDIIMDMPFAGCKTAEENICDVTTADIENGEWQGADKTRYQGKDEETLISQSSYMVCTKGWGIIYIVDNGQQIKSFMNELIAFQDYLQEQFGFDERTVCVIGRVYWAIQEKFANRSQQERNWYFARALSQIADYDNKWVTIKGDIGFETNAWRKGAGWAFEYGEENAKEFFCDELGLDEADYRYMRYMVRLQNQITSNYKNQYVYDSVRDMSENDKDRFQEWKEKMEKGIGELLTDEQYLNRYEQIYNAVSQKGDFAHMMYTLSANLINRGHKVDNHWYNVGAPETSWNNAEQRKDVAGWLGDAVYDGDEGKVSFGMDDYIADLDADNIAHMVTDDKSLVEATNEYYKELQKVGDEYRTEVFVKNNGYDKIEEAIFGRISVKDVDGDKEKTYKDLLEDKTYQATGEFLERLVVYSGGGKN